MKKIIFFIESLQCGGAEKSLLSLLNNIDYSNYNISLMRLTKGGEFEKLIPKEIELLIVDRKVTFYDRIKFKTFRIFDFKKKNHPAQLFWKSSNKNIQDLNGTYDIAIAWGQGFSTYFVSKKVTALKKYAWVNTDYKKAGYNWKVDYNLYQNYDKIIGISDFVKNNMQEFLNHDKVLTIRNIIDPEEIIERAKEKPSVLFSPDKINIVSVGRLVNHKAFELAIAACNIIINQGLKVHLYIIGEGIERCFLENEITKLNVTDHCTLLGFKSNPYPYIKASSIYLQTSRLEGLGRTVIEAGILCKPIVTTDFPSAYSILSHGKTGLISKKDPTSIAKQISRLINNKQLKELLVINLKNQKDKEKEKTLSSIYDIFNS